LIRLPQARRPMTHEHVLWIATAAYALHVLEEYEYDWQDWARRVLKLPVEWNTFYLANAAVIVLGVCAASVGWREPWFALAYPALMLINATFFHVLPALLTRVNSPGLFTAVLLFYPVGGWAYYGAWADGVLHPRDAVLSVALGAAVMAYPIVLLRTKRLRLLRQGG
jgi:hypothetical protein